ncbi:hypothetical protein Trydic_g21976 [Trypoxylus dichotomus]
MYPAVGVVVTFQPLLTVCFDPVAGYLGEGTTSESLRLFDAETISTTTVTHVAETLTQSKSSFVVTNVVSSAGIDSPEDESHSEEISRITDLETPSYSEETYSKDVDDEILPGAAVVNVGEENPVPFDVLIAAKSEQSPESVSTNPFALENQTSIIEVTTVQQTVTINTPSTSTETHQDRDIFVAKCNRSIGRFQVVKVESIEPFYRGRWTCHDYLDNSQHAPAEGWVFHQDRFIKKSESQSIPISPNIPDCLPTPNKQIPIQSQTPLELPNEAPAIVERTQEAPRYVHTNTTEHFPSFVGQAHQQKLNNRKLNASSANNKPKLRSDQTRLDDDVYLHNQYNLLTPDVLERIPTKSSLTKTHSSVSTSLHGSIAHTPPLSPNGDSLIQTVELNLPIAQIQGSFLQTPPETPLSIVFQYRNSKVKVPSEPVTPLQQAPTTTQHSNYFSLPTLHPIPSRTYPPIPQSDFAQVQPINERIYKFDRSATSRTTETVKEIKRQLSEDEADELIAHVETYLSGTEALDGDKDYIIMVKKSSDGTLGDNIVICREIDSHSTKTKTDEDVKREDDNLETVSSKGAVKKKLQLSYSDPTFKGTTCRDKIKKTFTERSISQITQNDDKQYHKSNVQKFKHIPIHSLVQSSSVHSNSYRLHKTKDIDKSIEEENDNQIKNKLNVNQDVHVEDQEECNLEEEETNAVLEIKIIESDSALTPSSEESDGRTRHDIFPGYFPVYKEWSSNADEGKSDSGDGEKVKKNICLICDISASLSFTVQVSHNSGEVER